MAPLFYTFGGQNKELEEIYQEIAGIDKEITSIYQLVGGDDKLIYSSFDPVDMLWNIPGMYMFHAGRANRVYISGQSAGGGGGGGGGAGGHPFASSGIRGNGGEGGTGRPGADGSDGSSGFDTPSREMGSGGGGEAGASGGLTLIRYGPSGSYTHLVVWDGEEGGSGGRGGHGVQTSTSINRIGGAGGVGQATDNDGAAGGVGGESNSSFYPNSDALDGESGDESTDYIEASFDIPENTELVIIVGSGGLGGNPGTTGWNATSNLGISTPGGDNGIIGSSGDDGQIRIRTDRV